MTKVPDSVIRSIRWAARSGLSTGRDHLPREAAYYNRCTWLHRQTGALVMFTRDTGHHSGGWFKNPDFERCWHLSLSFREPRPETPAVFLASSNRIVGFPGLAIPPVPFNETLAETWANAILGDDLHFAWIEAAFSKEGRQLGVRHWRVFCDGGWRPIKPRGEVYSRELTEAGWQSWSDLHAEPNLVNAE